MGALVQKTAHMIVRAVAAKSPLRGAKTIIRWCQKDFMMSTEGAPASLPKGGEVRVALYMYITVNVHVLTCTARAEFQLSCHGVPRLTGIIILWRCKNQGAGGATVPLPILKSNYFMLQIAQAELACTMLSVGQCNQW